MPPLASPYLDPAPRGFRVVLATLRIVVALECWGLAASWLAAQDDLGMLNFLQQQMQWTPETAALWMNRSAWALVACGVLTLLRPCWPVLIPVIACFGCVAAASTVSENNPILPAIHAVRILAPAVLLLLDFWPPKTDFSLGRATVAIFLLRLGSSATFLGIGLVCLDQARTGGPLVELLAQTLEKGFQKSPTADQAQRWLGWIGSLDVALGLGVLFCRSRFFALAMAVWGTLWMACRLLAFGPEAYHLVLIRAAVGGAPAALFVYWLMAVREQPPAVIPASQN